MSEPDNPAEKELLKLGLFLYQNCGDATDYESPAEMAVRFLKEYKEENDALKAKVDNLLKSLKN